MELKLSWQAIPRNELTQDSLTCSPAPLADARQPSAPKNLNGTETADTMNLVNEELNRRGVEPDASAFARRIAKIRKTGLAYDLDEHTDGIFAIGVAFPYATGALYAISVPVPSSRFPEVRELVESALVKTRTHAEKLISEE